MSIFKEELGPQLIKWGKPHTINSLVIDSELVAAYSVRFPSFDELGFEFLLKDNHVIHTIYLWISTQY